MYIIYFTLGLVAAVCAQKDGEACTDKYTSAVGICKPVEDCDTARQDLQESGIQPTFCSRTPFGSAVVCCRDGLKIFDTVVAGKAGLVSSSQDSRRVSERKCEEYAQYQPIAIKKVDYSLLLVKNEIFSISVKQCYDHTGALPSEIAKLGEFPHMVAIGWQGVKKNYEFRCGGSLISEKFVLTAAQCSNARLSKALAQIRPSIVRLGDLDLDDVNDGVTPIDIPIRRIHNHPDYHPPQKYNDIGLFELANDVEFNTRLRPACLGAGLNLSGYNKVIATGWNTLNPDVTKLKRKLRKASINLLENNYCNTLMSGIRGRNWMGFNDSQMCAAETNQEWDSCLNEGGSPIQVALKDNQCIFHVVGITSFGKPCSVYQSPSVYTRVSTYLDWIEGIVWPGE